MRRYKTNGKESRDYTAAVQRHKEKGSSADERLFNQILAGWLQRWVGSSRVNAFTTGGNVNKRKHSGTAQKLLRYKSGHLKNTAINIKELQGGFKEVESIESSLNGNEKG